MEGGKYHLSRYLFALHCMGWWVHISWFDPPSKPWGVYKTDTPPPQSDKCLTKPGQCPSTELRWCQGTEARQKCNIRWVLPQYSVGRERKCGTQWGRKAISPPGEGMEEAEEEFPLGHFGSHLSAVTQEGGRDLSICKPPKLALARFLRKAQKLLAWAKVLIGLVVPLNKWYNGGVLSHSLFHKQTWEASEHLPLGKI